VVRGCSSWRPFVTSVASTSRPESSMACWPRWGPRSLSWVASMRTPCRRYSPTPASNRRRHSWRLCSSGLRETPS
jgi:hypothetical protein